MRDLDRDDRPGAGRLTEQRYLSTDEAESLGEPQTERCARKRVATQALSRVRAEAFVFTTARGNPHGRRNVLRAVSRSW